MSCPKCGYCKECGRSNYPYQYPWYSYPQTGLTYTMPQTTVTAGSTAYPSAAAAQSYQISNKVNS